MAHHLCLPNYLIVNRYTHIHENQKSITITLPLPYLSLRTGHPESRWSSESYFKNRKKKNNLRCNIQEQNDA